MEFNRKYENKTPNRSPRGPSARWVGICWHGTGGNPANPDQTLQYNLSPNVASSYHVLISAAGVAYAYLDPDDYTAWHAGTSVWKVDGTTYRDYGINEHFLGVELDETNKGVPAPQAQLDAAARLALHYRDTYGIPLAEPYHVTHKQIAPGRKIDPTCLTVAQILQRARELDGRPQPLPVDDRAAAWGPLPVDWRFGIPRAWLAELRAGRSLGKAVTSEVYIDPGHSAQAFEQGLISYRKRDGRIAIARYG